MKHRNAVFAVLLYLMSAVAASAQYTSYVATPNGVSYGASPSVLSLEIQTGYPRAIVRKNDWTAFQTSGTMRLYQNGVVIASAAQNAGTSAVVIPFSWNFSSGTRNFYAMTTTNPYASGSVSVTAGYIPAPPGGVTATAASSSSVAVRWNAVSGATRYKVRHTNTGNQTGDLYTTSHTWSGLTANTSHCFVVLACGDQGFCSAPSAQACATTQLEQYKVGVIAYRGEFVKDAAGNDIYRYLTWNEIDVMLDGIRTDIAGNRPHRIGSNGREARVVVQMDVEWNRTEQARGQYDFSWFQEFARRCKLRGIKWTPLLSPHYVPDWALASYAPDQLRDMNGTLIPYKEAGYLKISPSSYVWSGEVSSWVRAFIDAMAYDGGTNHFGPNGTIDEILLGNEMTYPWHVLTSKDAASLRQWPSTNGPFPSTFTTAFRTFRADQLSYAINAMIQAAKGRLQDVGASHVGLSSKLYSYYFPRSSPDERDDWKGYTDSSIGFLDWNFRTFFAIDSYPSDYCRSGGWSVIHDYNAARSRSAKKLYVAEFNVNKGACTSTVLSRAQVYDAIKRGFESYNVRAFTFLGWNPSGEAADRRMNAEQKAGLADAMNWIVP